MTQKPYLRGVSFHHRSGRRSARFRYLLSDFFDIASLQEQIDKDLPPTLQAADIRRLIGDAGRNEINSRLSQGIDMKSKWTGILNVIKRCLPSSSFPWLSAESGLICEDGAPSEIEVYLNVVDLLWRWKHHLMLVEMAAQVQTSYRGFS